jgi:Asp-tRNA(Asn)/Glu-tRNA(Gln) amidotransferase A subunit family amidase
MGDIYCHTLLECDRDEPRQAYAYEGLPMGMQFFAAFGQDKTLLELAFELEEASPL